MRSAGPRGKVVEWIDGATIHRSGDAEQEDAAAGFAWSLYNLNLELLTRLIPIISRDLPKVSRKHVNTLKQSLGDLFLWGDGFRDGRLEDVLEESDDLRETLVSSLVGIGRLLIYKIAVRVTSTSVGEGIEELVEELEILLEKARILKENDLDSDGVSEGDATDPENHEDRNRLSTSISSLATHTTCLMDLVPSMEASLNFAQQVKDEDGDQNSLPLDFHVSGPARAYILNIYDRFSKADSRLVERLGEANWQRHIALRQGPIEQTESSTVVVEEASKSIFVPVSLFQDSSLGNSLPAQSSYAPTSASHTSFISSKADEESGGLRVPPTPKAVFKGIPFYCEICGQTLSKIKNRIDWKRHVFTDLKPYICTFSDCKEALRTFPTRKMWESHEFDQHRFDAVFLCAACPSSFPTEGKRQAHFQSIHRKLLEKNPPKILQRYQKKPHDVASLSCPLCLCIPGKSRRNFVTHVGKHMENIALQALPRENGSDSESNSDDGSEPTYASSKESGNARSSHLPVLELIKDYLARLDYTPTAAIKAPEFLFGLNKGDIQDVYEYILLWLERMPVTDRAKIISLIECLCNTAITQGGNDYIPRVHHDLVRIAQAACPDNGSGAANINVMNKLLQVVRMWSPFDPDLNIREADELLKDPHRAYIVGPLGADVEGAENELKANKKMPSEGQSSSNQNTSSYWSIPEQREFPELLKNFGTDWHGIANYMTSKTYIMVKNYYQRQVDSGKYKEYEEIAREADERIARGESIGPPPPLTISAKELLTLLPDTNKTDVDAGSTYKEQLAKFHAQRSGSAINRFPTVDKRPLDLYKLKNIVEAKGGFEKVCKGKKWPEIGREMGYSGKIKSSLSTSLKNSYERWLFPYEEYQRMVMLSVHQEQEIGYGSPSNGDSISLPQNDDEVDAGSKLLQQDSSLVSETMVPASSIAPKTPTSRSDFSSQGRSTRSHPFEHSQQEVEKIINETIQPSQATLLSTLPAVSNPFTLSETSHESQHVNQLRQGNRPQNMLRQASVISNSDRLTPEEFLEAFGNQSPNKNKEGYLTQSDEPVLPSDSTKDKVKLVSYTKSKRRKGRYTSYTRSCCHCGETRINMHVEACPICSEPFCASCPVDKR